VHPKDEKPQIRARNQWNFGPTRLPDHGGCISLIHHPKNLPDIAWNQRPKNSWHLGSEDSSANLSFLTQRKYWMEKMTQR